jgi:hypothetical protein
MKRSNVVVVFAALAFWAVICGGLSGWWPWYALACGALVVSVALCVRREAHH